MNPIYEPRPDDPVAAYPCGEDPRVEYEPGSQTREQRLGWLAARRELGLPCPGHPLGDGLGGDSGTWRRAKRGAP